MRSYHYRDAPPAHRGDGEHPGPPLPHQAVQLLFGEGVDDEAEDEERRQEHAQQPAQKGVHTHTPVVAHVRPEGHKRGGGRGRLTDGLWMKASAKFKAIRLMI